LITIANNGIFGWLLFFNLRRRKMKKAIRSFIICSALLSSAFVLPGSMAASPPVESSTQAPLVVNLNQASAAELESVISGVGLAKAEAIVAYRELNGPFGSVDDLLQVKGIGIAILDKNRARLMVE
jgi:competence protein ComEA